MWCFLSPQLISRALICPHFQEVQSSTLWKALPSPTVHEDQGLIQSKGIQRYVQTPGGDKVVSDQSCAACFSCCHMAPLLEAVCNTVMLFQSSDDSLCCLG